MVTIYGMWGVYGTEEVKKYVRFGKIFRRAEKDEEDSNPGEV